MFNTSNHYSVSSYTSVVNVKPACLGTIQKSSPLSRIVRTGVKSDFAKAALDEFEPHITKKIWHGSSFDGGYHAGYDEDVRIPIIVLQVMVFGDEQCLIEFITVEDYEKLLQDKEETKE